MHLSSPLSFLKICLKRFEYEEDLVGFLLVNTSWKEYW